MYTIHNDKHQILNILRISTDPIPKIHQRIWKYFISDLTSGKSFAFDQIIKSNGLAFSLCDSTILREQILSRRIKFLGTCPNQSNFRKALPRMPGAELAKSAGQLCLQQQYCIWQQSIQAAKYNGNMATAIAQLRVSSNYWSLQYS